MLPSAVRLAKVSLVLVLAAVASPGRPDDEPEYDGKKASVWVDTIRNDASARKRALAAVALGRLWADHRYKDALPNLGRTLRIDTSAAVRTQVAAVIGQLKPDDAKGVAADVVEALKNEKESRVRREIATALGRFPEVAKAAVEPLTAVLKDPDPAARAAAADALGRAGPDAGTAAPELLPLLADPDRAVKRAAVFALGRVRPEDPAAVGSALAKLLGAEKDAELRQEVVTSLGLLGDHSEPVIAALSAALADPDEELRQRAARVLATFRTGGRAAADALLKVAGNLDEKKGLRVDAVRAFGSVLGAGLKERVKDLVGLLEKDPDYEVRLAVVEEIAALGPELRDDKETIAALRRRQADAQLKVREAAAVAVQKITAPKKPDKGPDKLP
jgi:HEAT repeat protein